MDRVFLDANVLFSAAYTSGNRLLELWSLQDAELMTSAFAGEEAARNLSNADQRQRLQNLLTKTKIVREPTPDARLPEDVTLPPKDVPILLAAIGAQSTHLLTGDKRHFGELFGRRISGVLIQRPSSYFASRST